MMDKNGVLLAIENNKVYFYPIFLVLSFALPLIGFGLVSTENVKSLDFAGYLAAFLIVAITLIILFFVIKRKHLVKFYADRLVIFPAISSPVEIKSVDLAQLSCEIQESFRGATVTLYVAKAMKGADSKEKNDFKFYRLTGPVRNDPKTINNFIAHYQNILNESSAETIFVQKAVEE